MEQKNQTDEMLRLLQELVLLMKSKGIKEEEISSCLLFELYSMSRNNMSKMFSDSATWVDPKLIDSMLDEGMIQRVVSEDMEKYALTFKGLAQSIRLKYGNSLEDQFLRFLELSDHKFATTEQSPLSWKEKLASISLILMASTSTSSAIRLNSPANRSVFSEVLQQTLASLRKFGLAGKNEELKATQRGEHPVSALMSRVTDLARKTNLYYKNIRDVSGYYFDIETEGSVDKKRLFFLLKKVFGYYDENCDYDEFYRELEHISQLYSPRFLARSTNPMVSLGILKALREFLSREIWHLPSQHQSNFENLKKSADYSEDKKSKRGRTVGNEKLTSWTQEQ